MNKKIFPASFAAVLFFANIASAADCDIGRLDIMSDGNSSRFFVEIADDNAERARGLMEREYMAPFSGMLFIYDRPARISFWMRNTLIPLDMLFIDSSGVVQKIHENATPLDETPIPGGDNIQYVLEINGSLSSMLNISEGARIRHPQINQELAIWPCDDKN